MLKRIASYFLIWRTVLFFVAFLSIYFLPVFGGRFPYADRVLEITRLPYWIWGWGNFDGVHYLRIAQDGYFAEHSQVFFPLFPLLVRYFALLFPKDLTLNTALYTDPAFFYSGIILSNIFFLSALFLIYKLWKLDFNRELSLKSIILLLVFPTAFYFGAVYTESLFLLLGVGAVYLLRKEKYLLSALVIALATATRLIGLFLIPLYLIEVYRKKKGKALLWVIVMPLGVLAYMYFLKVEFGNPLYFLTSQPIFGAERTAGEMVLLPQVIYRYIKIFLTTSPFTLTFFNAMLEFVFALLPLTFLLVFIKKIRFSYWTFSFLSLILPTLTGTFSSMPRYALISIALLVPYMVTWLGKYYKVAIAISMVLSFILLSLFIRGYWIA